MIADLSTAASQALRTQQPPLTSSNAIPWPTVEPSSESLWRAIIFAILVTAFLVSVPFFINHRYYFIDDAIAEVIPKSIDIGRLILSGQFPWITTNIMNGGGYAHEYIMGVFNPINLILYAMQAIVPDFATGAYLRSMAECCVIAAAVAWFARSLAINTALSVALAVSVSFNPYTIAWTAAAWTPGLAAFTGMVIAVAAMIVFNQKASHLSGWLILFGVYCCLTGGYPHTVFVLGFFGALLLVVRLCLRLPLGETTWLAAWLAGGLVCSMVAIVPLLTGFEVTGRGSTIANIHNFNVASLDSLLQFTNPLYYGFFNNFGGYALQRLPQFYAAWFLLPIFVLYAPQSLPVRARALAITVLSTAGFCLMMAMGPEQFLVLRFPTRAIQFFHFFLIVLAALLIAWGAFLFSRRRLIALLSIEGVLAINTMQADPRPLRHLAVAFVAICLLVAVWWLGRRTADETGKPADTEKRTISDRIIVNATIAILIALAIGHPKARGVDWGYPTDSAALAPLHKGRMTLFQGGYFPPDWGSGPYREYRYSSTGLLAGDQQINGYSSIGNRFFRQHFPIDDHGNFAPGVTKMFAAIEPATGLQYLELAKVDQLVALNGPMAEDAAANLSERWKLESRGPFASVFVHPPYNLPGLVSYVSKGVEIAPVPPEVCRPLHRRECVSVQSSANSAGRLIFARLWLPGYYARLNGALLPVVRAADFLVGVDVPASASGILELRYTPPGLRVTGLLALITLGSLAAFSFLSSRQRKKLLVASL